MPSPVLRLLVAAGMAAGVLALGAHRRPRQPVSAILGPASGDAGLIDRISELRPLGRRLAVVQIEAEGTRQALWGGADSATEYEIGSVTKALTGLLIADAMGRGELALTDRLGDHLPGLGGQAAGLRLDAVVTHHSGLPRLANSIGAWTRSLRWVLHGTNPYTEGRDELLARASRLRLGPARFSYSNLGAALAGHAVASAAGVDYAELLRDRLLEPLGMAATRVQTPDRPSPGGVDPTGRPQQPWSLHGYAPAGGVVSTPADMARLLSALLDGSCPGLSAVTPLADDGADGQVGIFWMVSGSAVWHDGATGGYSAFLGLDPDAGRGVVVLSDVGDGASQLGRALLASG